LALPRSALFRFSLFVYSVIAAAPLFFFEEETKRVRVEREKERREREKREERERDLERRVF
jgi:hypothetical protein